MLDPPTIAASTASASRVSDLPLPLRPTSRFNEPSVKVALRKLLNAGDRSSTGAAAMVDQVPAASRRLIATILLGTGRPISARAVGTDLDEDLEVGIVAGVPGIELPVVGLAET